MNPHHRSPRPAKDAVALLKSGLPLLDSIVSSRLDFLTGDPWNLDLVIRNCLLEGFEGSQTAFTRPVLISGCHLKQCQFAYSYFTRGLLIENCIFEGPLNFESGGHNAAGFPIRLSQNHFRGFVNFYDCSFGGEILLSHNNFEKGSNIASKKQGIDFSVAPQFEQNSGALDLETDA